MPARRAKVLVIDDSETILDFTKETLEGAGYDVVALSSAALFPATLNREKPDVALIDVAMPVVDGQSLVSLARRNQLHHCVIALYSGQPEDKLKWMAQACGADGYIHKSADSQVLLANVERLLRTAPGNPTPVPLAAPGAAPTARSDTDAVLVVQTGAGLSMEMERAIRSAGCAPHVCNSSIDCLSVLGSRSHLACLVEVSFESRRGEALCRTIKEEPGSAGLPVIMLGADSSMEVMSSWRAGADDFLPHPLKPEQLTGKLKLLRAAKRLSPVAIRDRGRHVLLLIEPDPTVRGRLGTMLELSGYGLLYAQTAGEGLRQLEQTSVGVVVVDLDGSEEVAWDSLLAQMRKRFNGPLVALTRRDELAPRLRDAGLHPFELVNSQLTPEHVIKRINNCVHAVPSDLQPHLRVPFFSVGEFRPACGQAWKSGITFDLSPAGVFIRTLTPEPKGTLLDLTLQLAAFGARTACSGVVAWSNPYGGRGTFSYPIGMGVQLVGLKPDVSAQIARVLRTVSLGGFPARSTTTA
jgi:DNA-binding response OmpR family regulator/Tfp pilus assembly protein PilZ